MAGFDRKSGGVVRAKFDEPEADVLRDLLSEMRILLEAELPREDPVTARIFPQAYSEPEDQSAYQELIGGQLREHKLAALDSVRTALGEKGKVKITLEGEQIESWLAVLTDIRLAIGTRLDVTEETMDRELDQDDPDAPALAALHWLGWMQESILQAIDTGSEE